MHLLLDTCIVYNWLMGQIRDAEAEKLIQAEDAYVRPITPWEMAIKHRIGKLALPTMAVEAAITGQGFAWLAIQPAHAQALFGLPPLHRDPFDLFLIAQARTERMPIVTYDAIFTDYLANTMILKR